MVHLGNSLKVNCMSIEEFNEIVKVPSKDVIDKYNKKVYKNWFNSKKYFDNLVFSLSSLTNSISNPHFS